MTESHLDLGPYALDRLDPDARGEFERHLAECPECADELPTLRRVASSLGQAIHPIAPPTALRSRVLESVVETAEPRAEPATRRPAGRRVLRRPVLAFVSFASIAAAALLAVVLLPGGSGGELELQAILRAPAGQAEAAVDVRKTGIGRVISFRSDSLPILPVGEYYELWFVGAGDAPASPNRISAGTFHPDEDGRSFVTFAAAVDPALYPVVSVTAEPGDGDPRATGPEVLRSSPAG